MEIAIDFDGTCVTHQFPDIGQDIGAVPVLKRLVAAGHKLILYTMRSNGGEVPLFTENGITTTSANFLDDAVAWFANNAIPLYGIQSNPTQSSWTSSNKCYAQLYIDDAALGAPLVRGKHERPYIDWEKVEQMLFPPDAINTGV